MTGWFTLGIVMVAVVVFILPRISWISPKRASELIESGAKLLDVRSEKEFKSMRLFGSLNVPSTNVEPFISELQLDKRVPLIVFCQSGVRAGFTVKELKQLGFKNIYNLGTYNRARKAVSLQRST